MADSITRLWSGVRHMDRSLAVRGVAAIAVMAVGFVGCGTVMPGAVRGEVAVAANGAPTGAGGSDEPTAAPAPRDPVPGVTDDEVTVVFVGVDLGAVSSGLGFRTADAGDPRAQVTALADWVNANGGIAGRQLNAVYRSYEASNDSPAAEEQLCNQVTQDDKAFAVVVLGQFQANARPCYAGRHTLVLDATLVADDEQLFRDLDPYLVAPSYPEYNAFADVFVPALAEQGFLEGATAVGVIAADNPATRRAFTDHVEPALVERGATATASWIDATDLGTLSQGLNQAAIDLRSAGVDRVMFLGGSRLASFFMSVAAAQSFEARYAITSYDNPGFLAFNPNTIPPAVLEGMVGLGFNPSTDVPDSQYAFPATDAERDCIDIFGQGGQTFETRENARTAFVYCDAVRFLADAGQGLDDDFSARTLVDAAQTLGDAFVPAAGFAGRLGADSWSAADGYRLMAWDSACGCFTYTSEVRSLADG